MNKTITKIAVGIGIISIGVLVGFQSYKYKIYKIDYTNMNYNIETQETYNLKDYMVNLEEFIGIKKKDRLEQLENIKGLIDNTTYNSMKNGIDSEYFKAYCIAQYEVMYRNIQNMMAQMAYISNEYESIENIEKTNKCIVYDCDVIEYINKYMKGELKDLLVDTHYKYESLIKNEMNNIEYPNNNYIDMFYNEYLCTDYSHLKSIDITIKCYPYNYNEFSNTKKKVIDFLGLIDTKHINLKDTKSLEQLELYKCHNYYDNELFSLSEDAMHTFTLDDTLRPINTRQIGFTLGGLNEIDKVIVEYTVNKASHSNIKTKEEMKNELNTKAKIYEAQISVYDTIMNEIEQSNKIDTNKNNETSIENNEE